MSEIFTADVRASCNSLRDAMEITQKKASNDQYTENYLNNLDIVNGKLKKGEIFLSSVGTDNKKALKLRLR